MVIIISYPASPSGIMFLLLKTQSLIAVKSRKRKKEREKLRVKREQESIAITRLTAKVAKTLRSVVAFLCGAE